MVECYDVLVALLETETRGEASTSPQQLGSHRKSAESVARHLVSRLDRNTRPGDTERKWSTCHDTWEDSHSSGYSHGTSSSSTTSSGLDPEWSRQDEAKLREHISRLKVAKGQVQSTVMELESVHGREEAAAPASTLSSGGSSHRDPHTNTAELELAVLVQELMGMREERADLRARVYLLEKEAGGAQLAAAAQQERERLLVVRAEHCEDQLRAVRAGGRPLVVEEREGHLQGRVDTLLTTLDKVTRNSELRQKQSADLIEDLKKANE